MNQSGRQEKVREALVHLRYGVRLGGRIEEKREAALAEVEEWETRLAAAEAEALRYDTALAVLDASTDKIGEGEWIEEYRWRTGAYHKILGFRPKIMALAAEFQRFRNDNEGGRFGSISELYAARVERHNAEIEEHKETCRLLHAAEAEADRLKAALTEDNLRRVFWKHTVDADLNTDEGCIQAAQAVVAYIAALAPADRNTT